MKSNKSFLFVLVIVLCFVAGIQQWQIYKLGSRVSFLQAGAELQGELIVGTDEYYGKKLIHFQGQVEDLQKMQTLIVTELARQDQYQRLAELYRMSQPQRVVIEER